VFVDVDAADVCWRDGLDNESGRVWVEGDDVDGFAAQLLDDCLDARALEADAGADGIDVAVHGGDGDLGAVAWLAGAGLDSDDPFVDLGDLKLEELHQQAWMGSRQHDLRRLRGAGDLEDVGVDAVALAIGLVGDLLAPGEDRLGLSKVDDDVALLEAAHDSVDEAALLVLEFTEDALALGVADLLDDDLLCGLRRDATQLNDEHLDAKGVANLAVWVRRASLVQRDL
jgi:hypothetical protein